MPVQVALRHDHVTGGGFDLPAVELGWRPGDRQRTHSELDLRNRAQLGINRRSCCGDPHLGCAFRPRSCRHEIFCVNAVRARCFECFYAPFNSSLHGGCAWHATADFVGEMAQISFERRGFERLVDQTGGVGFRPSRSAREHKWGDTVEQNCTIEFPHICRIRN